MLAEAPDEELLSRLLRRHVVAAKPLGRLLELHATDLTGLGFSDREAEILQVASEIARRHQPASELAPVTTPGDAVARLGSLRSSQSPMMVALLLDRQWRLRQSLVLAVADAGCAHLSAGQIAHRAAGAGASGLIVGHNHIEGAALPTDADVRFTHELRNACINAEVDLADHLILTRRAWVSLRATGLFR